MHVVLFWVFACFDACRSAFWMFCGLDGFHCFAFWGLDFCLRLYVFAGV